MEMPATRARPDALRVHEGANRLDLHRDRVVGGRRPLRLAEARQVRRVDVEPTAQRGRSAGPSPARRCCRGRAPARAAAPSPPRGSGGGRARPGPARCGPPPGAAEELPTSRRRPPAARRAKAEEGHDTQPEDGHDPPTVDPHAHPNTAILPAATVLSYSHEHEPLQGRDHALLLGRRGSERVAQGEGHPPVVLLRALGRRLAVVALVALHADVEVREDLPPQAGARLEPNRPHWLRPR